LYCCAFGREEPDDENCKFKRTQKEQNFCPPWRIDKIIKHLIAMHPIKWASYEFSSTAEKMFFDAVLKRNTD
jgi:hypothetical protein